MVGCWTHDLEVVGSPRDQVAIIYGYYLDVWLSEDR